MSDKQKVHSLTGRITDRMMQDAFKAVKSNRGTAGIDKESIQMFEDNLEANLAKLKRELKSRGEFQPRPLRRKNIREGPDKIRPLGIPTVRDRIAQEVIRRLLEPIFEPMFHEDSYGFRPDRNCHMAIERTLELHRQGNKHVLDADIKGFFDNLPHKVMMEAVSAEIADGNILGIIERFLKAGVMEDGKLEPTTVGTPQGGVVSPLLANIVLNHLDWKLHEAGYDFVRYADDFVVICRSRKQADEARSFVEKTVRTLGLKLNAGKTEVTTFGKGYNFLGFRTSSRSIRMRPKAVRKFKDKIRELTVRKHNLNGELVEKLNRVIRGSANYFGTTFSTCRWLFQKLDSFVRRRLRCMKFNRIRRSDNRRMTVRSLAKLGLQSLEKLLLDRMRK